jgi:hypothetical protein
MSIISGSVQSAMVAANALASELANLVVFNLPAGFCKRHTGSFLVGKFCQGVFCDHGNDYSAEQGKTGCCSCNCS